MIGAAITVTDDDSGDTLLTATWNGNTITTEIDVNTNYTVSVETITGYLACADQSYQASYQITRNILFKYVAPGVYIESTDHVLYTSSEWSSAGKVANALVVLTTTASRRFGLESKDHTYVGYTASMAAYNPPIKDYTDMDGISNCEKIQSYYTVNNLTGDTFALNYCKHTFPDGVTIGYLGALGEMYLIWNNKTAANACLTALGKATIPDTYNSFGLLSSTRVGDVTLDWPLYGTTYRNVYPYYEGYASDAGNAVYPHTRPCALYE